MLLARFSLIHGKKNLVLRWQMVRVVQKFHFRRDALHSHGRVSVVVSASVVTFSCLFHEPFLPAPQNQMSRQAPSARLLKGDEHWSDVDHTTEGCTNRFHGIHGLILSRFGGTAQLRRKQRLTERHQHKYTHAYGALVFLH